jgi:hypothetical protein
MGRFFYYICCMEKQYTAIDEFIIELTRLGFNFKLYDKEIKKAKQIEYEQIKDSYFEGSSNWDSEQTSDQYYNTKYK